jgi:hypothetical protein
MVLPIQLGADLEPLRAAGHTVTVIEDGTRFYLVLQAFELPPGLYQPDVTDLMMMADYQYPLSRMDMFWTDPRVLRSDGTLPQNADQFEAYAGRQWQRWSWHYPVWEPARHNVSTHLEVVYDRLRRG